MLILIHNLVEHDKAQFIITTHSPLPMTCPDAEIISFDGPELRSLPLEETSHYQITRGMLDNQLLYWKHLLDD